MIISGVLLLASSTCMRTLCTLLLQLDGLFYASTIRKTFTLLYRHCTLQGRYEPDGLSRNSRIVSVSGQMNLCGNDNITAFTIPTYSINIHTHTLCYQFKAWIVLITSGCSSAAVRQELVLQVCLGFQVPAFSYPGLWHCFVNIHVPGQHGKQKEVQPSENIRREEVVYFTYRPIEEDDPYYSTIVALQ